MTPELSIEGAVATVTLRRPAVANRLEPDDLEVIVAHLDAVDATPAVLVLRFRGEGAHFCAGADIGRIGTRRSVRFDEMVDRVERARPVTIAALHGGVFGGATDLALACDFRVGGPATRMFMPAARLGLHFYASGLERYVTRLGVDIAKRLFLTAEEIDADEMRRIGFLTHFAGEEGVEARVDALTARIAAMAPLPLIGMKKHLNRIARSELDREELAADVARSLASEDLAEGAAAFRERRAPRFRGR
jgi:enoyl-CoA hydratase/carnithine racemase